MHHGGKRPNSGRKGKQNPKRPKPTNCNIYLNEVFIPRNPVEKTPLSAESIDQTTIPEIIPETSSGILPEDLSGYSDDLPGENFDDLNEEYNTESDEDYNEEEEVTDSDDYDLR
jgi:hypothetical protein